MNRVHEISKTLSKNIDDAKSYSNYEFVLLDYNSSDGLEDWVRENFMEHIESGKLVFYRTEEPQVFHYSCSRNIAWKLATGDLVTNIASKGFLQAGFLEKLNLLANQQEERDILFVRSISYIRGRIAFYKDAFFKLGGFDEELSGYSPWDRDIFDRSKASGYKLMWFGSEYGDYKRGRGKGFLPYVDQRPDGWKVNKVLCSALSSIKVSLGMLVANEGHHWGKATLVKNFEEEVKI
jgi:hypothetical protein